MVNKYNIIIKIENIEAETEKDALKEISDLLLKMKDNKYAKNTKLEVHLRE